MIFFVFTNTKENNKLQGIYKSKNIKVVEGKIVSLIKKPIYILKEHNNTYEVLRMDNDITYHCDCVDSNDPLNYCEDYTDSAGRLRCRGSACCEGYITDDKTQLKIDNGILITADILYINNEKF